MMRIIQRLVDELGKTVIVVLHDINFAAAYAGHVVTMKDGEIYGEGNPSEIITPKMLNPVFDHDFNITEHDGKPVVLCYDMTS
jgi:iron complex transport system ATP-binding protein